MGSDSVNNEKILKKLDELTKLDKKILTNVKSETTLSDEEKQRLNNISESSNSVNTSADKLTKALNFVIALSLVVFAAIIIGFFHGNQSIIVIASAAIGGVVGYLVPNTKKS